MSFGVTAALVIGTGVAAASIYAGNEASQNAQDAAQTQSDAAQAGIDAINTGTQSGIGAVNDQFSALQKLLSPYVGAGTQGLTGQQDLMGLNGGAAQGAAIDAIQRGPGYQRTLQTGQNAILQNQAATGGLRGGNIQGSLAGFSADALNQAIDSQYNRLGQFTSLGANAASQVGQAGMQAGNTIAGLYGNQGSALANLLGQQGAANAAGQIASNQGGQNIFNGLLAGLGAGTGLLTNGGAK